MSQSVKVRVPTVDDVRAEYDRIVAPVRQRAYELFLRRGGGFGRDLDDWLEAERELIGVPRVDLGETNGEFVMQVGVPGFNAGQIDICASDSELLVFADAYRHRLEEGALLHLSELSRDCAVRMITFPKTIEPEKVKAELRDGLLRVSTSVAEAALLKSHGQSA